MPKTVQMPDGKVVEFPDNMSDDQVSNVLKAQYAPPVAEKPAQQGFFGSALDSSGLASVGHALMHPFDTAKSVIQTIGDPYNPNTSLISKMVTGQAMNTADNLKQGVADFKASGLSRQTRRDFGRAIPIVGPTLATAQAQHDAGNDAGMAGTLAGTIAGVAAPKLVAPVANAALRGVGQGLRLASADAASLGLTATRVLAKGSPGELLQAALKPGVKYGANVGDSLEEALPKVIAAQPDFKGVSGFASASDAARNAAHAPFRSLLDQTETMPVSTQAVADAARGSVSRAQQIEDPLTGAVRAADKHAGIYDDKFSFTLPNRGLKGPYSGPDLTVGDLNEVRKTKNAQLNKLLADTPADRNTVLTADPKAARLKAIRDESADTQYAAMSGLTGVPQPEIQGMQDTYGLLRDVSDIANKREPVFARHDPVTLSQKIVSGHGNPVSMAWNYLVQHQLGNLTNSDALVNSAVDRFQNPAATPLVARPGIVPQIGMRVGGQVRKARVPGVLVNPFMLNRDQASD